MKKLANAYEIYANTILKNICTYIQQLPRIRLPLVLSSDLTSSDGY